MVLANPINVYTLVSPHLTYGHGVRLSDDRHEGHIAAQLIHHFDVHSTQPACRDEGRV